MIVKHSNIPAAQFGVVAPVMHSVCDCRYHGFVLQVKAFAADWGKAFYYRTLLLDLRSDSANADWGQV